MMVDLKTVVVLRAVVDVVDRLLAVLAVLALAVVDAAVVVLPMQTPSVQIPVPVAADEHVWPLSSAGGQRKHWPPMHWPRRHACGLHWIVLLLEQSTGSTVPVLVVVVRVLVLVVGRVLVLLVLVVVGLVVVEVDVLLVLGVLVLGVLVVVRLVVDMVVVVVGRVEVVVVWMVVGGLLTSQKRSWSLPPCAMAHEPRDPLVALHGSPTKLGVSAKLHLS